MKISVITINYNNKAGLERTVGSVVEQTFPDVEYIVIDGGSKDGSDEIIRKHQDKISYWVSEPDKGIYNAMNKGIAQATGDYILFLNSGDMFARETAVADLVKEPLRHDIIYGDLLFVEDSRERKIGYPEQLDFSYFVHNSLPHPASLIRKTCFQVLGLYDEHLKIVSDWKFFILAICKHNISYEHRPVVVSKFYNDGISSAGHNRDKIKLEKESVFNEHFTAYRRDYEELIMLRNKWRRISYLNPLKLIKRITRKRG